MSLLGILGAALIGGAATYFGSRKSSKETNKANASEAEKAYQRSQEAVNQQNAYNTPAMQMQRLKDAGLNPNLAYGMGTVGNQTSIPEYNAPRMSQQYDTNFPLLQAIGEFSDFRMKNAQVNNLTEQNKLIVQQAVGEGLRNSNTAVNTAKSQYDLDLAKELRENSLQAADLNVRQMERELRNKEMDTLLKNQDLQTKPYSRRNLDLDNQIKELDLHRKQYGVEAGDPLIFRLIMRAVSGDSPINNWFN